MTDFEIIYMEHFDNVYGYVLSLCRDETIAEEVFFVRVALPNCQAYIF